jgi:hypothetical protein
MFTLISREVIAMGLENSSTNALISIAKGEVGYVIKSL